MSGYAEQLSDNLFTAHKRKQGKTHSEITLLPGSESENIKPPLNYWLRRQFGWVALGAAIMQSLYIVPIDIEEHALAETHATFNEVLKPTNEIDTNAMSVVIGGMGTRDSTPIVEALSPLDKIGSVVSIEEDNKGIDTEAMANQIMAEAEANGQTEIGLWGTSVGGIVVTQIARRIQESHTDLHVGYIMLDCTPTSFDTLRPEKQHELQTMETLDKIFPGADKNWLFQYGWSAHVIGKNVAAAASGIGAGDVMNYMNSPETPSTELEESQATYILDQQMKEDFTAIAKVTSKTLPLIMAIRPTDPNGDAVVNSTKAIKQLESYLEGTGLTVNTFMLDGISHGDPTANRVMYQAALNERILPYLNKYEIGLLDNPIEAHLAIERIF